MTNASYVRDELVTSMPNDALGLVLDLSGCRYLDSAGIEVLFDLARRLARRRQVLHVALPDSSPLRRVLTLTDVPAVAPVHNSLEEGVAAVR
jgi:anti-anti-sigma factor